MSEYEKKVREGMAKASAAAKKRLEASGKFAQELKKKFK